MPGRQQSTEAENPCSSRLTLMIGSRRVLIATHDGCQEAAAVLQRDLACDRADQNTFERLDLDSAPTAEQLRRALHGVHAAIVLLEQNASGRNALALIDAADHTGIPVLVLRNTAPGSTPSTGTFAGALSMPASSPPASIRAALDALIHAGVESRRLRSELSVATRQSGGLEGEIVRMHEELQLAAMVQRELLPRELPFVHGVSFGTLWRPANYVSGDIFDVARLDEDHVGVFLTDAVGHGVPAALLTMVISRSLVMKEITGNEYRLLPPSEVLTRLNEEMLQRQGRTTRFATGVYALINCRERTMQFAGAGHPAPFLLRKDGEMKPLETTGGLLGIFADEQYEQIEIELGLDDRILFYSDGFEQAFPSQTADEHERRLPTTRYRKEFEAIARSGMPQEAIEQLRKRLDLQNGSLHQADDLTLICAHAGPLVKDDLAPSASKSTEASEPAIQTSRIGK